MKDIYSQIRFSHLTSFSGTGSLLRDVYDNLVTIPDIRKWDLSEYERIKYSIKNVNRVKCYLGIPHKQLLKPPDARIEINDGKEVLIGKTLSAVIFPKWTKCNKCKLLHYNPWKNQEDVEILKCKNPKCNGRLQQVSWVLISNYGHLSEVPWHFIAHDNNQCRQELENNYLIISESVNGKTIIKCQKCNAEKNILNKKPIDVNKIKFQPWESDFYPATREDFETYIVSVSDPRIYSPVKQRAIVIPPESRNNKSGLKEKILNETECFSELARIETAPPLRRESIICKYTKKFNCTEEQLLRAYHEIKEINEVMEDCNLPDLSDDEYKAFTTEIIDFDETEDFITSHKTSEWKNLPNKLSDSDFSLYINIIDKLVIAQRLRVIEIFKGFFRIKQQEPHKMVKPDIDDSENWLPAIELYGEGIFISFPEGILRAWESLDGIVKRTNEISLRVKDLEDSSFKDLNLSSRFIFLHTFAHLLIKELENSAGYPAASLKERIFSSSSSNLAGVLIYVAVPDIVGTLGGIIEKGEPEEFLSILINIFNKAEWCSNDPICAESEGHGPANLNRAACNSCLYIPETACDYNNIFLDRVYIKGDKQKGIPQFLEFIKEYFNGRKKV
ncbi:MAG: DUF1998 domain-containing protein [Melioribacteraceae bacterium]|nr:DUF1998 domain-containing protein [Melioribacteraceae bacterium]